MARISLTPPRSPFFSSSSSSSSATKSTGGSYRSNGSSGGGSGFTLIHSINSFWAKFTRATKKKMSPKSPPAKPKGPKNLLMNLGNKGSSLKQKKKSGRDHDRDHHEFVDDEGDFGDGGLWQRSIMMGDKCQPLDFSGVIYYDSYGKQLQEFPMRSPRASPLPSYLYGSSEK